MRITVEDTGHVYRNPAPNVWARQAYFPSIVALDRGALVASFDMGTAMENPDGRTYTVRSDDGGKTWSAPRCIYEPTDLGYPASTLGRMSKLRDGTLVALLLACDRSRTGEGLANVATEGYVETRFATLLSTDEGATWSAPRWVDPPLDWNAFEICSPIHETPNGHWLLPTSLWRKWDGAITPGMKAVVFRSEDRGLTWTECVDVLNNWDQQVTSWEQKLTRMSDGRWLAVCWAHDYANKKSLNNRYAFSHDDARGFGPAIESPLPGETCTPLALPDNHILCIYRRTDERGLWAHLARIENESWIPLSDTPLWGTNLTSYTAQSANKMEELSTLRFGYPLCVRIADGKVFVVFWCVEDCVACIRWFRLRVEGLPDGCG